MSCEICKRGSCTRSFHSLQEQERFDARQVMSDDVGSLREDLQESLEQLATLTADNAALKAQLAAAEPVGYVASFECNEFGRIDMKAFREGEFTTPVYKTAPPQHAAVDSDELTLAANRLERLTLEFVEPFRSDVLAWASDARRAAEQHAARVPERFVLVPIEPTDAMLDAHDYPDDHLRHVWEVMLLAAPTPPAPKSVGVCNEHDFRIQTDVPGVRRCVRCGIPSVTPPAQENES